MDQNRKSRQFHSFAEDEFGEDGYLADAWGGRDIRILVDYDGDGLIELSSQVVDEIKVALKSDYDTEQIEEAAEKFRVIRDKVAIYVLEDRGETDSQNVFSWDIKSFLPIKLYIHCKVKMNSRGFTLMELLVVLAVMGVMMGLVGFSLLGEVERIGSCTKRVALVSTKLVHKLFFPDKKLD